MQPLHELLHRIQWDPEFGKGRFTLEYYDRVAHEDRRIPFTAISLDAESGSFSLDDGAGVIHIPLHRVHTVYKDDVPIWRRPRATSMPSD